MSPVTISLTRLTDEAPLAEQEDNAFVAGLKSGGNAFAAAVGVVRTILGALLPFAVVGLLIGVPLVMWWRRHRPARPVTQSE